MLEAMEWWGIDKVTDLSNMIYSTGEIPAPMQISTFITIPKKPEAMECNKHRTISIMSQLCKIICRVIMNRIRNKINFEISEEQYGFRKGTTNAIFNMRMLSERAVEMQKDVYLCFIDYEKAFDTVRHADMLEMLRRIGADSRDIRVIRNLYYEQKAALRVENELTDTVDIKRGVRHGCVLSPDLFSLYGEVILRDLVALPGFKIGGRNLNNIRYADDTVLIADSEQKLQDLVDAANTASEEKGLKINESKTECMTITKGSEPVACAIHVNQHQIKQVDEFEYLGSILTKTPDARGRS